MTNPRTVVGAGTSGLYAAYHLLKDGGLKRADTIKASAWCNRPSRRVCASSPADAVDPKRRTRAKNTKRTYAAGGSILAAARQWARGGCTVAVFRRGDVFFPFRHNVVLEAGRDKFDRRFKCFDPLLSIPGVSVFSNGWPSGVRVLRR